MSHDNEVEEKQESFSHIDEGKDEDDDDEPTCLGKCCRALICVTTMPWLCCCCITTSVAYSVGRTMSSRRNAKRWDKKQRKWVKEDLLKDSEEMKHIPDDNNDIFEKFVANKNNDLTRQEKDDVEKSSVTVKETSYYDILDINPDATEVRIKIAYYKNASKYNPDQNDCSSSDTEKFQQLSEAYQILLDPKLRDKYNSEGEAGLFTTTSNVNDDDTETELKSNKSDYIVDPSLLYTFSFGNDAYDNIIGRLDSVIIGVIGREVSTADEHDLLKEIERRRIIKLALSLKERIQPYVEGSKASAKKNWEDEAANILGHSYGQVILNTVGNIYKVLAKQYYGSKGEGIDSYFEMQEVMMNAFGSGGKNDILPRHVTLLWNETVVDISDTLHEVVMKVLYDTSVSLEIRRNRALAIQALGEVFQKAKTQKQKERRVSNIFQRVSISVAEGTLQNEKEDIEQVIASAEAASE